MSDIQLNTIPEANEKKKNGKIIIVVDEMNRIEKTQSAV